MDYILYTTEGFTKILKNSDIENCQILNFQYDTNMDKDEAIESYLEDNPLIKTGFSLDKISVEIPKQSSYS